MMVDGGDGGDGNSAGGDGNSEGGDSNSAGGGGADHNLHSTDFELRHQEEPA